MKPCISVVCLLISPFLMMQPAFADLKQDTVQAMQLLQAGQKEEALARLKELAKAYPKEPAAQMNYGSLLFGKAASLFKQGAQNESKPLFDEAEKHLVSAGKLFSNAKENKGASQSFFLLGDIYQYIRGDKKKAAEFYNKSLSLDPQNKSASQEIQNVT